MNVEAASDFISINICKSLVYFMGVKESVYVVILSNAPDLLLPQSIQDLSYYFFLLHELIPIGKELSSFIFFICFNCLF